MILKDGWYHIKQKGTHHQYKHPTKTGKVIIPELGSSTYFGKGLINTGYAVQRAKYLGLRRESIVLNSITKTSAGNAKIKWSELYNAEGYCISRATSANGTYSRLAVVDNLPYVDKSVKAGKTYYYKVRGAMYYGHGSGTVNGKNAGYSMYSGVKYIKIK